MDESEAPIVVVFQGVTYKRNPDGEQRAHRVYYNAPRGSGRGLLHRDIWAAANGPIPDGWHVHHRDEDPFNNDPGNLVALTPKQHAQEHAAELRAARQQHMNDIRHLASAWHRSEAGQAWHHGHGRRSWEGRVAVTRTCELCQKTFPSRSGHARFCSRACMARNVRREARDKHKAVCPVCGATFMQGKYGHGSATCSRSCGRRLASVPKPADMTSSG